MSENYKKEIMDYIKDEVNKWIDVVKKKYPDKLITRQWQILFPKGYVSGNNTMPVVTGCKDGKYLIGEVQFVLPTNLDLSLDDVELVLKEEPYVDVRDGKTESDQHRGAMALDDSIDILNHVVCSINDFINSLKITVPGSTQLSMFSTQGFGMKSTGKVKTVIGQSTGDIKQHIESSPHLPSWIKDIESRKVYDELIEKLTGAYQQYGNGDIGDFFKKYEQHLKNHGHLHYFCKYKGKIVILDEREHCTESYCSKKPYNSPCSVPVLRFGGES